MGSEMCIRDRAPTTVDIPPVIAASMRQGNVEVVGALVASGANPCLLYTSDAADERSSVDLGGRRIIKQKTNQHTSAGTPQKTNNNTPHEYKQCNPQIDC